MSMKEKGKVFRDPVHGLIRIAPADAFILDLIDTPEFQRLRRIRQLGLSSYTYPGAEHSRFAHSMGVYWLANRVISILEARYPSETRVKEALSKYRRPVLAAAILHDLGHGPFSHTIERALPDFSDHEAQTVRLITGSTAVNRVLREHQIIPETVAQVISKTLPVRWLVDIISSQLDADRMDYLLRDSMATGVQYGLYDAEWLLNCMCLGHDPEVQEQGVDTLRLCLDASRGLYSVEQLIMARMHMSYQVYYHPVTRGWEAHLICLLNQASRLAEGGVLPEKTPDAVLSFLASKGSLTDKEWLYFDESALLQAFSVWAAVTSDGSKDLGFLKTLSADFLNRKKAYVCHDLADKIAKKRNKVGFGFNVQERLTAAELSNRRDFLQDDTTPVFYKIPTGETKEEKMPWTKSILLADGSLTKKAACVESRSSVLEAISNKNQPIFRLYCHRSQDAKVTKLLNSL